MTASRAQVTTLAALLAAGAPACRGPTRRTPDDTIVLLLESRLSSLDPRFTDTNHDTKLSRIVVPGLTVIDDETMEPRLLLAESIVQVDDRTVDVTLRRDLRFSDGTPVTAADVVYTYQSTLDPSVRSLMLRGFRERFVSIEALDGRRARFHLVAPVATLASDFDYGVLSAAAARDGRLVGAGPYRLASFHPEDVRLDRNPHWLGPPPPVEHVRVRVVPDAGARALMLVGGSADLTLNSIRIDLVGELGARDLVDLATAPSAIFTYMMMNNRDPVLRDVRVRRAIAYAIDRESVVRSKLGGRAVLATGLVPPGHWAYNGDVERYRHDPALARALLDEAGYPDPDGPGGRPRLRLTYKTSSDQLRRALARVWAAQLAEVGIEVEVQSFEMQTFFTDIKRGTYQLASMQTSPINEPDWLYAYFHSDRIPGPDDPNAHNRWRYANPRVDELTAQARRTLDRAARRALYAEVQEILARDLPVIPLWHEHNVAVMSADLRGFRLDPSATLWGLASASKVSR
ncbi:MAG TPA: ABC transporter substrate-binding protein [Kofleriaceae bacterium]|nr:ABC transporter substrate-binding protein [Kofleriaceae bacterium]